MSISRILLHTCCGPCTIYPLKRLRDHGMSVHGFFYNPFIQPYQEFERRLAALEHLALARDLQIIVRKDYDLDIFFREVAFREQSRCVLCYSTRIEAAARLAKKSGLDAFTTTLLYSKQQKHDLVQAVCDEASRRFGIPFYYEDFRLGWKEGQEGAKALGLYRQQYCGCIYSEKDRFLKSGRKAAQVLRKPSSRSMNKLEAPATGSNLRKI
jgi:predicted adenine nucleotide alpha hydrolase (AANH) superfamily ATPase